MSNTSARRVAIRKWIFRTFSGVQWMEWERRERIVVGYGLARHGRPPSVRVLGFGKAIARHSTPRSVSRDLQGRETHSKLIWTSTSSLRGRNSEIKEDFRRRELWKQVIVDRPLLAMVHGGVRSSAGLNKGSQSKTTAPFISRASSEGKREKGPSGIPRRIKSVTGGGPCSVTQELKLGVSSGGRWPESSIPRWS